MITTCVVWLKRFFSVSIIVFAIFFVEFLLKKYAVPSYFLPKPSEIFQVYLSDGVLLAKHFGITFLEWVTGILLSVLMGFVFAFLSFHFSWLRKIFDPLLVVSQSVPYLIFAPLLMIWLGLGLAPKIVLVVLTCTFPIAMVLQNDLISAKKEYQVVVSMLRLGPWKSFWHVYFPSSLPGFFNALKISSSYSFVAAVLAELIGSESGLGIYILRGQTTYRTDKVFAAVLIVVLFSVVFAKSIDLLKSKVIFWQQAKR